MVACSRRKRLFANTFLAKHAALFNLPPSTKFGYSSGIKIQTYCAIIACLLISLWTGRKPTLRTYEMICYYFSGLAAEDELLSHIAKLQEQPAAKSKAAAHAEVHRRDSWRFVLRTTRCRARG